LFNLFIMAILVFYTGELVWRERSLKMNELHDVLPIPNWLTGSAKLLALLTLPFVVQTLGMLIGIITQLVQGYTRIEPGLWISESFVYNNLSTLYLGVMFYLVQVLTPNKFLGFFISVLLIFQRGILSALGIEDNLFLFNSSPGLIYSDMNGYGHFAGPWWTFKFYWFGLILVFLVLANLLYVRGTEINFTARKRQLQAQFKGGAILAMIAGFVIFLGTGAWIYYNTNVLNDFVTSDETQEIQIRYEKDFKRFEGIPQPRVTAIYMDVDLYPQSRDFKAKGKYTLKNKSDAVIDSIHMIAGIGNAELTQISFDRAFDTALVDDDIGYHIYKLGTPLQPGDSIQMEFSTELITKGFTNSSSANLFAGGAVFDNGTFLNSTNFPAFGYNPQFEIGSKELRKEKGLPPKDFMAALDDCEAVNNNFISQDADWIDFEAVVSTDPDQIAMVPGYLQKEWEENGRRYFHYKMDSKMIKFFNIVSGRYAIEKEIWKAPDGRDISLEIYYHPDHDYNIHRMMKALKVGLEYYSREFSPYQHRQVRILEFPRYAGFAQSFANTIPYSEDVGFIIDVGEDDVDLPFYITAHELGHQWWAHQVIGGDVQGSQLMSETMSQYAAVMAMNEELSIDQVKRFLRHELDLYLQRRSGDNRGEKPLLTMEAQQYIHYNKGSVIMWALQDYLGADSLNMAMKRYIDAVAFQEPPYTTTTEWLSYVDAVTPDSLKYLLDDMVRNITLFDNKVLNAEYVMAEDSSYALSIDLGAKKLLADEDGNESPLKLKDYIDVGVFGRVKVDGEYQDTTLYLQKHLLTEDSTRLEISVPLKPSKVGIDPYYKLVDRKPADNSKTIRKSK
ncbi:MAG: M1 family aminopeptidase, partial [Bacteroidota bacterium]